MNSVATRKRVLWLTAIGGALLLSVLFITLLAPSPGPAATEPVIRTASTPSDSEAASADTGSDASAFSLGGGDLISLGLRLGLVILIIAASVVALRWWGRKTAGPRSSSGFLRVVDTLAVGNGRSIHLVALGERVIAIGATSQQLSYLSELTGAESGQVLELVQRPGEQSITSFAAELFHSIRGGPDEGRSLTRETLIGEDIR